MHRLIRRARRFSFNLLATMSLVVCAAVVAMWADSYRGMRMIETAGGGDVVQLASRDGVAVVHWNRGPDGEFRWQRPTQRFQVLGLAYADGRLSRRKPWSMLVIPYWMPTALAAILPAAWALRRARTRLAAERAAAGLCLKCGTPLSCEGSCAVCSSK